MGTLLLFTFIVNFLFLSLALHSLVNGIIGSLLGTIIVILILLYTLPPLPENCDWLSMNGTFNLTYGH